MSDNNKSFFTGEDEITKFIVKDVIEDSYGRMTYVTNIIDYHTNPIDNKLIVYGINRDQLSGKSFIGSFSSLNELDLAYELEKVKNL